MNTVGALAFTYRTLNGLEDIVDRLIALLVLVKLALFASVASYALTGPVQGGGSQGIEQPVDRPEPVPVQDALADAEPLAEPLL